MRKDLDRAVKYYKRKLDQLTESPRTLKHAPDSHLHVILRHAGYERKGPKVLGELSTCFEKAGIATFPELTDPRVKRTTRIYFFQGCVPEGLAQSGPLFPTEKLLETFLVTNFEILDVFKGLKLRRRQYRFPDSKTIDLLCEERATRRLVGIEIKHEAPDSGLVNQMGSYMKNLLNLAEAEKRAAGARGVIITGLPDPDIAGALRSVCRDMNYQVDWYLYRADLKLAEDPNFKVV